MGTKPNLRRVAERPDPQAWGEDEILTLPEAALLFWPRGPLRVASLRTAARDGKLAITVIAGKMMTTKRALRGLAVCTPAVRRSAQSGSLSSCNIVEHLVKATEERHRSNPGT